MRKPSEPWQSGFAVRRDWPDGSHELIRFNPDRKVTGRRAERDREYWARGPMRPRRWSIVEVSRRDFDLHQSRQLCRAPDCPTADEPALATSATEPAR